MDSAWSSSPHGDEDDGLFAIDSTAEEAPRHFRLRRPQATLITSQERTREQSLRKRRTVYLILQLVRLPLLALALLSFMVWQNWWLSAILFVVSIPLPWAAVVFANEKGEAPDKRSRNVYKPAAARAERYSTLSAQASHVGPQQTQGELPGAGAYDEKIIDATPDRRPAAHPDDTPDDDEATEAGAGDKAEATDPVRANSDETKGTTR